MSISNEITRLQTAKSDLKSAIENKGVTVPSATKLDGYASLVDNIEGGGGGKENEIIDRTISGEYVNGEVTSIGDYAFYQCSSLTAVSFPQASSIGASAFRNCFNLAAVSFPQATSIYSYAFYNCIRLATISFPQVTSIDTNAFAYCSSLTAASFLKCANIGAGAFTSCINLTTVILSHSLANQGQIYANAFSYCVNLLSVYLLASTLYKASSTTAFGITPISTYTTSTGGVYGSIFVPQSLYSNYISSMVWSYFSSRFASLTDAQISKVLVSGTHI